MSSLPTPLRKQLERAIQQARSLAEAGAHHALEALAVHEPDFYPHMDEAQRHLRRQLRAQARQLGDTESRLKPGAYELKHLAEKLAYDQWHRLLFARYLLENNLLLSPEHGVAVTLDDCEELAPSQGLKDAWAVAARFAAKELPEIFRADDPAGAVELSVNDRQPLVALVTGLPVEVFTASDSLGWCYQFWQAEKKAAVNAAGNKIGADELPAVTQLFTEDYMVDFLLDNTLGAWWAGKVAAASSQATSKVAAASSRWSQATSEEECRQIASLPGCPWRYLRFIKVAAIPSHCAFLDKDEPIENQTGDLPHWRQTGVTYFVTFRCADSLPAEKLDAWRSEIKAWLAAHPEPHDDAAKREFYEKFPQQIQQWLDSGYGRCLLKNPAHKKLLEDALQHFDGTRYDLNEYIVAANHVHVLVTPRDGYELSDILHSWKSFTANKINEAEGLSGVFWQKESFDHIVRNENSLNKFRNYIREHDKKNQRLEASATFMPAAGTFEGWPKTAQELTCLDPCMGSGHFVVAMFERLVALRLAEEALDPADAVAAVIRDNLFGLELDPRCTQIAAFNLALAAWRRVGHCPLPPMHLACSGLAPNAKQADWLALAGDNERRQRGMANLYTLFKDAPVLGSLINPRLAKADLMEAGFREIQPLLAVALAQETKDDAAHEMAVTAWGVAKAAEILAGQFTLVATNVPYLGRGKQNDTLMDYCERVHAEAKADLATCFVERCLDFCASSGTTVLVSPQNWLFLTSYYKLRLRLLRDATWNVVAKLGPAAFRDMNFWAANTGLTIVSRLKPIRGSEICGLDVSATHDPEKKGPLMLAQPMETATQLSQIANPDARIALGASAHAALLQELAEGVHGMTTGDLPRMAQPFWESSQRLSGWEWFASTVEGTCDYGGRSYAVLWHGGNGPISELPGARKDGQAAWGKPGVLVSQMNQLPVTLYSGELFDNNSAVISPEKPEHLSAIWTFCSSREFYDRVRDIDQQVKVTNSTLVKVPFDLAHWQKVAAEKYPHGLPKPFSSDPTQWLFNGHPRESDQPLHVAVARLLGYQWPRQTGSSFPDCPALDPDGLETLADEDGIVCLSATKGEAPAAERLRVLLAQALGPFELRALLASAGPGGKAGSKSETLEAWLRDEFFEQHCALFHHRPFIWHVWDGHKSGFSALVNYHKLDHANLEKLTYAYLGDWIRRQQAAVDKGEAGSDARLEAAKNLQARLKLILEGEPPFDLFVRWKPLASQAVGWHPDLNDGVRLNLRPFLAQDLPGGKRGAGSLRSKPNVKWEKDRGKEPVRAKAEFPWFWGWDEATQDFAGVGSEPDGNRWNNCHYSNAVKQAARAAGK